VCTGKWYLFLKAELEKKFQKISAKWAGVAALETDEKAGRKEEIIPYSIVISCRSSQNMQKQI